MIYHAQSELTPIEGLSEHQGLNLNTLYRLVIEAETNWHGSTDNLDYMSRFDVPTHEPDDAQDYNDRRWVF